MKRFFLSLLALSVAGVLLSGCGDSTPPPKPKPPKVVKVKPEPKPKAVKTKEAKPGTAAYLDAKNGFRDLTFGSPSSALTDLKLVEEDAAHQLKTYVRANEELSLVNVPLEKIEYTFFDDRLCQITLYWNITYPSNSTQRPTTSELSGYCTTLYGRPTKRTLNKEGTYYVWHGQKTGLMLTENLMPGVPNVGDRSGWAIAPSTAGEMFIYSEPLRRTAAMIVAKQNGGGL